MDGKNLHKISSPKSQLYQASIVTLDGTSCIVVASNQGVQIWSKNGEHLLFFYALSEIDTTDEGGQFPLSLSLSLTLTLSLSLSLSRSLPHSLFLSYSLSLFLSLSLSLSLSLGYMRGITSFNNNIAIGTSSGQIIGKS
jgi:hypothetical protein